MRTSAQLIGRGRDIEELSDALLAGINVVLAGPRRTGKTSVACAALARAQTEAGVYVAAVDLFRLVWTVTVTFAIADWALEPRSPHQATAGIVLARALPRHSSLERGHLLGPHTRDRRSNVAVYSIDPSNRRHAGEVLERHAGADVPRAQRLFERACELGDAG